MVFARLLALLVLVLPIVFPVLTAADSPSSWIVANPTYEKRSDLPSGSLTPITLSANKDCQPRKMITRPERLKIQSEQSRDGCFVDTGYGGFDKSGLLQRQGTEVAGPVYNRYGGTATIIPIPRSGSALMVSSYTSYGAYVELVHDFDIYLDTTILADGSVYHRMKSSTPFSPLTDKSGQSLSIMYDSISFSTNGDWLIADVPYVGFVRINTVTREMTPFTDPTDFRVAVGASYRTAISPDGRYAVVASSEFVQFKIYDLATCGAVPARITSKVTCQSRNILPFVTASIPGYIGSGSIRFRGNYSLDIYASYVTHGKVRVASGAITAAGQQSGGFDYLGLGDSFASGEGAYEYKAITDTTDNMCHLSLRSYPYLISRQLSFGKTESVACSGSVINDIYGTSETYEGRANYTSPLNKQLVADNILPGYIRQEVFVEELRPDVISVSTVGNDIDFAGIIKRCVSSGTCYSTYEERLEKVREIDRQFSRLSEMYTQLRSASSVSARVYAIGYPRVANPDGDCGVNVRLNAQEVKFADDLTMYLNAMIDRAAKKAGVYYVDVSDAFKDHKLCDRTKAIAVNGLTAGKDAKLFGDIGALNFAKLPIGNESYHPNAYGHELLAAAILSKTNDFTATMPDPQPNLMQPSVTAGVAVLDNVSKSGRATRQLRTYDEMGNAVGTKGKTWQGKSDSVKLQPGSKATVEIHSTPTKLGEFTASSNGTLAFDVVIPQAIEPGFHTMHIMGKNIAGEDVDLEKTIYVQESADDYDGDGIANTADPCPTATQAGVDADKDGFDDACDPLISDLPAEPTPDETPDPQPYDPQPTDNPQDDAANQEPLSSDKYTPLRESDPWGSYITQPPEEINTPQPTQVAVRQSTTANAQPQVLAVSQDNGGPSVLDDLIEDPLVRNSPESPSPEPATAKQNPLVLLVTSGLLLAIIGMLLYRKRKRA